MRQGVEAASEFVLKNNYPEIQRRIAGQLVQEWAVYDRKAALDWMAQLTDDQAFRTAQGELLNIYERITNAYMTIDPLATSEWVAGIEKGDLRDRCRKANHHK